MDALVELTVDIVSAYVSKNPVPAAELPTLIGRIHASLDRVVSGTFTAEVQKQRRPAVPVKLSVTADYIVCLEDGKELKTLRRYLARRFGLTPDEYRARWNLPDDYPMVAPNYSALRSDWAKKTGLGRKQQLSPSQS